MCPTGTTALRHGTPAAAGLRPAFDVLDADRDGKISKEDLRAFYAGFSGAGASEEEDVIGSMMSAADENKDGFVQYEEFESVLKKRESNGGRGGGGRWGVMEEAFKVMDRDGDGLVGHDDLKSYLKWAGFDDTTDEDIAAMIRLAGGDENQGVTLSGLLKILAV